MNSVIALPATAPQTTGHPLSLPADQARVAVTKTVQPIDKGSGLDAGRDRGFAQQTPRPKLGGSDEKAAPPTIMQMKIESMLMEQAEEIARQAATTKEMAPDTDKAADKAEKADQTDKAPAPEIAKFEAEPVKADKPEIKDADDADQDVSEDVDSKDRSSDLSTLP